MSDGLVKLFPVLASTLLGAAPIIAATNEGGMSETRYDYIVCGRRHGGCLLANRLSADKRKRVLLVEAGGNDDYLWVHVPVGYLYCIGNPRTDWLYATDPDPGLNGRSLSYPRGKVLSGGCSSINGMIYMRGQARLRPLGRARQPGLELGRVPAAFPNTRTSAKGADAFHAAPGFDASGERPGGEWRVEKQRLRWEILDAFAQAAQQAGIRSATISTAATTKAWATSRSTSAPACAGTRPRPSCVRWSSATTCRSGPARIRRLLLAHRDERRILGRFAPRTGIEVLPQGRRRAHRGAAGRRRRGDPRHRRHRHAADPAALRHQAPAALLRRHGIAVEHALAGVGENLQDHLQIRAVFQVEA